MFFKIINLIKTNYILKKKNIKIKLNKKDLEIIKIFLKLNIIKMIKKKENIYTVYFQYINNSPVFWNIQNMYKPSKPIVLNLNQINKINKKNNNIFIVSTNKGLLTNFEAEHNKIGGLLIMKIKI